ncbi:MAG: class I tRNA ligase family protein [Planctomycetaceae bacterium]
MSDLPLYEPKPAQDKWFAFWESHGYFNADPQPLHVADAGKPPHTIMIPLPNVTERCTWGTPSTAPARTSSPAGGGCRATRPCGCLGTDYGIATQAVVDSRMLEEEKPTRHDIAAKALVERIWKWKAAYEKRIIGQLKQIGASCDRRRTRFTLDEVCSRAVRWTFFKMFKDVTTYRGAAGELGHVPPDGRSGRRGVRGGDRRPLLDVQQFLVVDGSARTPASSSDSRRRGRRPCWRYGVCVN